MIDELIKELEQRCPGCTFCVRPGVQAKGRRPRVGPAVIITEYGRRFVVDLDELEETAEQWFKAEIKRHPLDKAPPLEPAEKYRIICPRCGVVIIGYGSYRDQTSNPDAGWFCPTCGGDADFDTKNYESYGG